MNTKQFLRTPIFVALAATVALSACGRDDDTRTAGQRLDSAVATTERKTEQMASEAKEAARDAKQAATDATKQAGEAMSDAAITTAVNAELAKDASLSALKIDVDTNSGRVQLKGTAPNAQAKERATQLASGVKGVVSVDNQLQVGGAS